MDWLLEQCEHDPVAMDTTYQVDEPEIDQSMPDNVKLNLQHMAAPCYFKHSPIQLLKSSLKIKESPDAPRMLRAVFGAKVFQIVFRRRPGPSAEMLGFGKGDDIRQAGYECCLRTSHIIGGGAISNSRAHRGTRQVQTMHGFG